MHIDGEASICSEFQTFILGADGEAIDFVGDEKMVFVINGQRPETIYGWSALLREGYCVAIGAIQRV